MKAKEVHDLSDDELGTKVEQLQREMFNFKFQFFTGQLENTARMKDIRKDIARVKTEIRTRQIKSGR